MGDASTKVVAIVQARMGSTRLPGKVLLETVGKPLIVHMLERVSATKCIDELWLATSENLSDDSLAETVTSAGFKVFRGSESDVLLRFFQLAQQAAADVVVRLTGDCPLHDPAVIDRTVGAFLEVDVDYGSNIMPRSYPDGLDTEVFTFVALEDANKRCRSSFEREHVTPGIHRQDYPSGASPKILNVSAPANFSHMRWTLDYYEDYEFIREVYEALYKLTPLFGWLDVVALTTQRPELLQLNRMNAQIPTKTSR